MVERMDSAVDGSWWHSCTRRYHPEELTFLRGYALEQLGRTNEAISEFISIPDGRNEYYGKRSTNDCWQSAPMPGLDLFSSPA